MIKKLSDLKIGQEYFFLLTKDKRLLKKAVVKGIINEFPNLTEVRVDIYRRNGQYISGNLFYAKEIGIGETADEAFDNYGKFNYEENEAFASSLEELN